jgi:hypothetical protein
MNYLSRKHGHVTKLVSEVPKHVTLVSRSGHEPKHFTICMDYTITKGNYQSLLLSIHVHNFLNKF